MEKSKIGNCDTCNAPDSQWRCDPYDSEILNNYSKKFMCDNCYNLRCEEI